MRFAVKDTGPGIAAADQERLFMPFVQLQSSDGKGGTGLGLAISRQFVELMSGTLKVTSILGEGTEFHFEIPITTVTSTEGAVLAHGPVTGMAPGQRRYRLLVVEDQAENRLLLHRLLEPMGFELHDAPNGQEAIECWKERQPDLIFMDIRMPVMDGMEATRRIRQEVEGAKIPIVALTAHALEDERLKILESGCNDFVRKPYREGEIFEVLRKHLGIRFTYGESAAVESTAKLDAERLGQLPRPLLDELLQTAELLDQERCLQVAGKISDIDHDLGEQLRCLIEGMQYRKLLDVLDQLSVKG